MKLYIRAICLITEHFTFTISDIAQFDNIVTDKMALTAQDSLSAKALKQIQNLNRSKKANVSKEVTAEEQTMEMEVEEEVDENENENENENEEEMQPKEMTLETKQKILRLVLTVVIPDLRR